MGISLITKHEKYLWLKFYFYFLLYLIFCHEFQIAKRTFAYFDTRKSYYSKFYNAKKRFLSDYKNISLYCFSSSRNLLLASIYLSNEKA